MMVRLKEAMRGINDHNPSASAPQLPIVPPQPTSTTGNSTYHHDNFYKYRWAHRLILLILMISIAIAADVLYTFPHQANPGQLDYQLGQNVRRYGEWMTLDFVTFLVYTFVGVCLEGSPHDNTLAPQTIPASPSTLRQTRLLRKLSPADYQRLKHTTHDMAIVFLVVTSALFNVERWSRVRETTFNCLNGRLPESKADTDNDGRPGSCAPITLVGSDPKSLEIPVTRTGTIIRDPIAPTILPFTATE